jgi:hypothetical protein
VTEGFARGCASNGIVYLEPRSWAARGPRFPVGLSAAGFGGWPRRTAVVLVALVTLVTLALYPSLVARGGWRSTAGTARPTTLSSGRVERLPIAAQGLISTALGADRSTFAARS